MKIFNYKGIFIMTRLIVSVLLCFSISAISISYSPEVYAANKKAEEKKKTNKVPLIRKSLVL